MNTQSQKQIIRQHLFGGGKLTSMSAFYLAGSLRLSERLREIEAEDKIRFDREWITVNEKRVLEYSWPQTV